MFESSNISRDILSREIGRSSGIRDPRLECLRIEIIRAERKYQFNKYRSGEHIKCCSRQVLKDSHTRWRHTVHLLRFQAGCGSPRSQGTFGGHFEVNRVLGFENLNLKLCELKLWELTVWGRSGQWVTVCYYVLAMYLDMRFETLKFKIWELTVIRLRLPLVTRDFQRACWGEHSSGIWEPPKWGELIVLASR